MKIRITIANGMTSSCCQILYLKIDDGDLEHYEGESRERYIDECVHEYVMQRIEYSWDEVK